jgi:hypothetical protein
MSDSQGNDVSADSMWTKSTMPVRFAGRLKLKVDRTRAYSKPYEDEIVRQGWVLKKATGFAGKKEWERLEREGKLTRHFAITDGTVLKLYDSSDANVTTKSQRIDLTAVKTILSGSDLLHAMDSTVPADAIYLESGAHRIILRFEDEQARLDSLTAWVLAVDPNSVPQTWSEGQGILSLPNALRAQMATPLREGVRGVAAAATALRGTANAIHPPRASTSYDDGALSASSPPRVHERHAEDGAIKINDQARGDDRCGHMERCWCSWRCVPVDGDQVHLDGVLGKEGHSSAWLGGLGRGFKTRHFRLYESGRLEYHEPVSSDLGVRADQDGSEKLAGNVAIEKSELRRTNTDRARHEFAFRLNVDESLDEKDRAKFVIDFQSKKTWFEWWHALDRKRLSAAWHVPRSPLPKPLLQLDVSSLEEEIEKHEREWPEASKTKAQEVIDRLYEKSDKRRMIEKEMMTEDVFKRLRTLYEKELTMARRRLELAESVQQRAERTWIRWRRVPQGFRWTEVTNEKTWTEHWNGMQPELTWHEARETQVHTRSEVSNRLLVASLELGKLQFSQDEWRRFDVQDLTFASYVRVRRSGVPPLSSPTASLVSPATVQQSRVFIPTDALLNEHRRLPNIASMIEQKLSDPEKRNKNYVEFTRKEMADPKLSEELEEMKHFDVDEKCYMTLNDGAWQPANPFHGHGCSFTFILAYKLRKLLHDRSRPFHRLPVLQYLRQQHPDWLVEAVLDVDDIDSKRLIGRVLAISHRWEEKHEPDPNGHQLEAVIRALNEPDFKEIELVWIGARVQCCSYSAGSIYSLPQKHCCCQRCKYGSLLAHVHRLLLSATEQAKQGSRNFVTDAAFERGSKY